MREAIKVGVIADKTGALSIMGGAQANTATLVIQLFVTGRVLGTLGIAVALALLPGLTALGFGVLAFAPTLATVAVFQVLRRSLELRLRFPAEGRSPERVVERGRPERPLGDEEPRQHRRAVGRAVVDGRGGVTRRDDDAVRGAGHGAR